MPMRRLSFVPVPAGAYTPPGSMNVQVTLLLPGRADDGSPTAPSPFASTWASVRALQGQELYKAQQIDQEVTHLVTIPYQVGITQAMLVKLGDGRLFQIKTISDPDERKFELRLLCVERGQSG